MLGQGVGKGDGLARAQWLADAALQASRVHTVCDSAFVCMLKRETARDCSLSFHVYVYVCACEQARSSAQAVRKEAERSFHRWQERQGGQYEGDVENGVEGGGDGWSGLVASARRAADARLQHAGGDWAGALSGLHSLQSGNGRRRVKAVPEDLVDVLPAGRPARTWMTPPALPPWTAAGAADLRGARAVRSVWVRFRCCPGGLIALNAVVGDGSLKVSIKFFLICL